MSQLEQILANLLVPNNDVISQATAQLKQAAKDPQLVPALCSVLSSSTNPQVRQYAAVLLRRRIYRVSQWRALVSEICQGIRENILNVLVQESEHSVQQAICQLIGVIAKHDLPRNRWPQLFAFIHQCSAQNTDIRLRELGMWVLSVVASSSAAAMRPLLQSLITSCSAVLSDAQASPKLVCYTLSTLNYLVDTIGSDEMKPFQTILPKILSSIARLVEADKASAIEAMEILETMMDSEVAIVVPHLKEMINFSLQVIARKELGDEVRIRAMSFISLLAEQKRKSILKLQLIAPILEVLIPVMCEGAPEGKDIDDEFEECEDDSPAGCAAQVIDTLAQNLPPEKFVQSLCRLIEPEFAHEDPHHRRAAMLALAVSAEGCCYYITSHILNDVVQRTFQCLADPNPMVQNAALFAIGQFAEYFQPEINKFAAELLPVLFKHVEKVTQNPTEDNRSITKAYYALETFCDSLGDDLLPYLPQLMQYLLTVLQSNAPPKAKELSLSSISSLANASKDALVPYLPTLIEQLRIFLVPQPTDELFKVQVQAVDTLGVLAKALGVAHFGALAIDSLRLGLGLLANATDPDLRRCVYVMFSSVSGIVKEGMKDYNLDTMVRKMIDAIHSTEGVKSHGSDVKLFADIFDECDEDITNEETGDNDETDEESDDDNAENNDVTVENAYLNEKEDAVYALGQLALNTGESFMPFMEEAFRTVLDLLSFDENDIRRNAATTLSHFCCAMASRAKSVGDANTVTALHAMCTTLVPKFITMIREDTERKVVMDVLEALNEMITKVQQPVLQDPKDIETIMSAVGEVFFYKTACQDESVETGGSANDDDDPEYDSMLLEYAGELIPSLCKVVGGQSFAPYFGALIPQLMKKLKQTSTVADKSFALGVLGETVEVLGSPAAHFVASLYPAFVSMLQDADEEVRSNAVFAIGILMMQGQEQALSHYSDVLQRLSHQLKSETDPRVRDNICAALCRMTMAHVNNVPLDQVYLAVLDCLPLQKDLEEVPTVFNCIDQLYQSGYEAVVNNLAKLVSVSAQTLTSKISEDSRRLVLNLLATIASQYPGEVQKAASCLPSEVVKQLQGIF